MLSAKFANCYGNVPLFETGYTVCQIMYSTTEQFLQQTTGSMGDNDDKSLLTTRSHLQVAFVSVCHTVRPAHLV